MGRASKDLENIVAHFQTKIDRIATYNAKVLCRKLRAAGIMVESWRDYMGGVVIKGGTVLMQDWNGDLVETHFEDVVELHLWHKLTREDVPEMTDEQWNLLVEVSEFIDHAVHNGKADTGEFSCI